MKYEMYVAGIGYVGQVGSRKEAQELARTDFGGAKFVLNRL